MKQNKIPPPLPSKQQPKQTQYTKPEPFKITKPVKKPFSPSLTNSFEIIDDIQPKHQHKSKSKHKEIQLTSNKLLLPQLNLDVKRKDTILNQLELPYGINVSQLAVNQACFPSQPSTCSCGKTFVTLVQPRMQCKCCKRYYCTNCLTNGKCLLCSKHGDVCFGYLLSMLESSNEQTVFTALVQLTYIIQKNIISVEVLQICGLFQALPIFSEYSKNTFYLYNLLVTIRTKSLLPLTDKEYSQMCFIGTITNDERIVTLIDYLLIASCLQMKQLPPTINHFLNLPLMKNEKLFSNNFVRFALQHQRRYFQLTHLLLINSKIKQIQLDSITIYDLIQLLPNPFILY